MDILYITKSDAFTKRPVMLGEALMGPKTEADWLRGIVAGPKLESGWDWKYMQ